MKVSPAVVDAVSAKLPEIPREQIERTVEAFFEVVLPSLAKIAADVLSTLCNVFARLDEGALRELAKSVGVELPERPVQGAKAGA